MHHVVVQLGHHGNSIIMHRKQTGSEEQVYHGQRAACLDWLGLESLQALILLLLQLLRETWDLIIARKQRKIRQ